MSEALILINDDFSGNVIEATLLWLAITKHQDITDYVKVVALAFYYLLLYLN